MIAEHQSLWDRQWIDVELRPQQITWVASNGHYRLIDSGPYNFQSIHDFCKLNIWSTSTFDDPDDPAMFDDKQKETNCKLLGHQT